MPVLSVMPCLAAARFDEAKDWYERLLGRPADSEPMDGVVEIGYGLRPSARGRGLMVRCLRVIVAWCAEQPDVCVLVASTDADNVASQRTLSGAGFEVVQPETLPVTEQVDEEAEKAKTASIVDPEGNRVTFAQQVAPE